MKAEEAKEIVRNYLETYRTNANILIDSIEQQAKQIEQLKCCGNCQKLTIRNSKYNAFVSCGAGFVTNRTDKCDKWEGIHCADQQQKKS